MARARNIKPGLFKNEVLGVADPLNTLLFEGLWLLADREGRLEDRPMRIKAEVFPYRSVDVEPILAWLQQHGFIRRWSVGEKRYIQILEFAKHQNPHKNEAPSEIPEPPSEEIGTKPENIGSTRADSLNSDSGFSDSLNSVPNGTGGSPPKADLSPDAILFGYGVPYLVEAGSKESNARSFIGRLRKLHGDAAVIDKLRACLKLRPSQPIEWLAAALPPEKAPPQIEWYETQTGIEDMGESLGLGRWDESGWKARGFMQADSFIAYKARVMAAHAKGAH